MKSSIHLLIALLILAIYSQALVLAQSLPPVAPDRSKTAKVKTALPAPSAEPEGEMPPSAPPVSHRNAPQESEVSSPPERFTARLQPAGEQMQGMDGQYGQHSPLNGEAQAARTRLHAESGEPNGTRGLTQVELKKLADHEVVLLIDRSGSMSSMDCPTGNSGHSFGMLPTLLGVPMMSTSRWNWCLQQTSEMSRQTQGIFQQGITMVLFSSGFQAFPNVTMDRLPQLFSQNRPGGGTNLSEPLVAQIGEYFKRRNFAHGNLKPLMIGIITDGCPNNREAVVQAVVGATQLMHNAQEVTIIFFMIGGMDPMGERFVHDLSSNLQGRGARFPIVKEVSFSELQQIGLARAIAQNLQ